MNLFMLILTSTLIFIHSAIANNNFSIDETATNNFHSCVTNIINTYFLTHSNILIDTKIPKTDIISPYVVKIGTSIDNLRSNNELIESPASFTISYEYLDDLNKTLTEIKTSPWFSNTIYYLIIANNKADLLDISEYLWHFKLYRSVVLLSTLTTEELYEIDFNNLKCGAAIKPKKINQCTGGQFKHKIRLFSADMKTSFYKCPFRIIWSKASPFVFHVNHSNPGIYIEIMKIFQQLSQLDVIYMPETDVYKEELTYEYSFQSILDDFERDYADAFVGLVSITAGELDFQVTSVLYDDKLYFILPKPQRIPYWKTMTKLFSLLNWIFFVILFIVLSYLFTLLASTTMDKNKFGNLESNLLHIFSLNLNIGFKKTPQSFRMRSFLGSLLILTLVISAVIQGKIYSFISSPLYECPITNLEQLLDSDVPIRLSEALRILFLFSGGPLDKRVLKRLEVIPTIDMLENSYNAYKENFATIIDRGVLIMNPNLKSQMQIFELFPFQTCFFMQRNHVLYEYFDKTLQRIIECGFIEKFVAMVKFHYSDQQYIEQKNELFRISLAQMEGPFFTLAAGYLLSLVALICEYIYFFSKKYLPFSIARKKRCC